MGRLSVACLIVAASISLGACGGNSRSAPGIDRRSAADPPGHVHGLGVNPADESLFVATHTGLFRAPKGESQLERVGRSRQDTMGFTVVSENTFLGSGHPDARDGKPAMLGLLVSEDAGASWRELSLGGQVDLHVIRVGSSLTYGVDARTGSLLVSNDSASTWSVGQPPEALLDLAVDPGAENHLIGSTEGGLYRSRDRGSDWRRIAKAPSGLLAWARVDPKAVYLAERDGSVRRSRDAGRSWRGVGDLRGTPVAMTMHRDELYVALADGIVKASFDGGRTWALRTRPTT